MASRDSPGGQPNSAQNAVTLQCLEGISRAGRGEPAAGVRSQDRGFERREDPAIELDQAYEYGLDRIQGARKSPARRSAVR